MLLRDLRPRIFEIGGVGVESGLADRLDFELFLVAMVIDLTQLGGCLKRPELADVVIGAERQQHLAGRDIVSGVELNVLHDARDLKCEISTIDRPQTSDRLDLRLPLLHSRGCG